MLAMLSNLINVDSFVLSAQKEGVYEFAGITNFKTFKLQGGQDKSFFSSHSPFDGANQIHQSKALIIEASGSIVNSGVMIFSVGAGYGEINAGDEFRNDGLICLSRMGLHCAGTVPGNGCWVLGKYSHIQIDGSLYFSLMHTIVIADFSSYVKVIKLGVAGNVYSLYGTCSGLLPIRSEVAIAGLTYCPEEGRLHFYDHESNFVIFDIGRGFDPYGFWVSVTGRVFYDGTHENERDTPPKCMCPDQPKRE